MAGLLKFITCGSVDDGKSTLIGHMLYDAKLIFADQKRALELDSRMGSCNGQMDYSLLMDGLMAEREQRITIDVAYRYFSTDKRSFIVADAPGHEEYTRNMAVGASFSDLAVILVDSVHGILPQTRRHAKICSLMGISSFVFAINKMDLVDYNEERYLRLRKEIQKLAIDMDIEFFRTIPVSATEGDNIIVLSSRMPWYAENGGEALLPYLEDVEIGKKQSLDGKFVLPIQRVCRPCSNFRGFQGEVTFGMLKVGDEITILPNGEKANVREILVANQPYSKAIAGQPVTVQLDREVDVSRGCVFVKGAKLTVGNMLGADVLWMDDEYLVEGQNFWCKIGTKTIPASVLRIKHRLDIRTGEKIVARSLKKNSIASCDIALAEKVVFDSFSHDRSLGAFILIDRVTYHTAACGMIRHPLRQSNNLVWQHTDITRETRAASLGQKPVTIWFTGLSGSGKSTLANALEKVLHAHGKHTMLLDGDNVRLGLNKNLGFTEADRIENIRRISEVARLMNDAGLIVLTAFISPYRQDRERAREIIGRENFIEVFVSTPLEVCEKRDAKGLYAKARNGEIPNFTGIAAPYEPPASPDISIDTDCNTLDESVEKLLNALKVFKERNGHGI